MVGVNKYVADGKDANIPLLAHRRGGAAARRSRTCGKVKATRDAATVDARASRPSAGARSDAGQRSNLMPPIIEAAKAYCTQQEICDVLREVLGTYTDPAEF